MHFKIVSRGDRLKMLGFLMQKLKEDGEEALSESQQQQITKIFNDYFEKVYKFFFFRLRKQSDAEDLTSKTFERIMKNLDKYDDRGHKISAWIFTIARNILIDFYRENDRKKTSSLEELDGHKSVSADFDLEQIDRSILKDKIWEIVNKLPAKQQQIWALKLTKDLSHKDIAEILGISLSNVNVLIHRSTKVIKCELAELI